MKNKSKKILAGLALGLVGAVTLTGCASNIVFNQEDLDRAITNVNNYLEQQNNYSSEFAYNSLMDSVISAIDKYTETTNFKLDLSVKKYDTAGVLYDVESMCMTRFVTSDAKVKTQVVFKDTNGTEQLKYYYVATKDFEGNNYDVVAYDLMGRTYVNHEDTNRVVPEGSGGISLVTDYLHAITMHANMENAKIMMDRISDNEAIYKIVIAEGKSTDVLSASFKDGKLVAFSSASVNADMETGDNGSYDIEEYEISYDVEDFSFDVNGFTAHEE